MEKKLCSDCGQTKPMSEFNAHKATADGLEKRCKVCRQRKVEIDRANRAFCEAMRKRRFESQYPSPQFVYGLIDPRTGELRYIGHSHNPAKRLQTHVNKGSGENRTLHTWISELKALGVHPELQIIERVDESEFVLEREYRWILKGIRDGLLLLNAEAHQGGIQRDGQIASQVLASPCVDFLTEPRLSPLLHAIEGWGSIRQAGDQWFRKSYPLREAIWYCLKHIPSELPPRLQPEVEKMMAQAARWAVTGEIVQA